MPSNASSVCELCGGRGYIHHPPSDERPFGYYGECVCRERERRRRELTELMRRCGITPEQFRRWTFATFDPAAAIADAPGKQQLARVKAACQAYALDPRGNLLLAGSYGCGKTHLAYSIAGECYRHGSAVHCCTVPDLLDTLRQAFDERDKGAFTERFQAIRSAGLLVLDDLGAENITPWSCEKLYQIVDYRYRQRLPSVVTTNVNLRNPGGRIEPRVLSRLVDASDSGWRSQVLLLPAGDYRQR
jgi:DNA replication protein DnaC